MYIKKTSIKFYVDNFSCLKQEVAAEVVQKLEPSEASAVFVEVYFPKLGGRLVHA